MISPYLHPRETRIVAQLTRTPGLLCSDVARDDTGAMTHLECRGIVRRAVVSTKADACEVWELTGRGRVLAVELQGMEIEDAAEN